MCRYAFIPRRQFPVLLQCINQEQIQADKNPVKDEAGKVWVGGSSSDPG